MPVEGFNPVKVRDFVTGIQMTLGCRIASAVVFDRDYRSVAECSEVEGTLKKYCVFARIHSRKELENFLLNPAALRRAIEARLQEQTERTGKSTSFTENMAELLEQVTAPMRNMVLARCLERRRISEKHVNREVAEETIFQQAMEEYDGCWSNIWERLKLVPGKETFAKLNKWLQEAYGVTISTTLVIECFRKDEIDPEMVELVDLIDKFRFASPDLAPKTA